MNVKNISLLSITLIASLTVLWAQSDSLQAYPVPKYKLWKLIHAWQALPVCDSTVTAQEKALTASDSLVATLETSVMIKDSLINAVKEEARLNATLSILEKKGLKEEAKKHKKQAFKVSLIAVVEAVIIILLL